MTTEPRAAPNYAAIPAELRARPQWATHVGKVPKNPATGENAAPDDPNTCSPFEQALEALKRYGHDGVAYLFTPDDPYTGTDIDHCIDETGNVEPSAQDIVKRLDSYSEISTSGTGVHIITRATLPGHGRKKGGVEMYDANRFFVFTGNHLSGTPTTIQRRPTQILAIHSELFPEPSPSEPRPPRTLDRLDDRELLDRAFSARNGGKVRQLWEGDTSAYGDDESSADLALLDSLAFYSDDAAQLERLWLASPLGGRSKTQERGDYRERTIAVALKSAPIRAQGLMYQNRTSAPIPDAGDACPGTGNTCAGCTDRDRRLAEHQRTIAKLQRERDQLQGLLTMQWQVLRNRTVSLVQKVTALAVLNRCTEAVSHDELPFDTPIAVLISGEQREDDPDPGAPYEGSLCDVTGLSRGRVSTALKACRERGWFNYDQTRETVQVIDRSTGELRPALDPQTGRERYKTVTRFNLVKPALVTMREIVAYRPPVASDPPELGNSKREAPTCPEHGPDAATVTIVKCDEPGCSAILDVRRRARRLQRVATDENLMYENRTSDNGSRSVDDLGSICERFSTIKPPQTSLLDLTKRSRTGAPEWYESVAGRPWGLPDTDDEPPEDWRRCPACECTEVDPPRRAGDEYRCARCKKVLPGAPRYGEERRL